MMMIIIIMSRLFRRIEGESLESSHCQTSPEPGAGRLGQSVAQLSSVINKLELQALEVIKVITNRPIF